MEDIRLSPLYDVTTEELMRELNRRFDRFMAIGFLASPSPEDNALQCYMSEPSSGIPTLVNYVLAERALRNLEKTVKRSEEDDRQY